MRNQASVARLCLQQISLVAGILLTLSCSNSNEGPLSRDEVMDIAAHHLMGKSFDVEPDAKVSFSDGQYTVTIERPAPGGTPGETYVSRVVFDAETREAIEIEVADAPRQPQAEPPPGETEYPSTPLNEEVDSVGELQRQMGH